MNKKKYTPTRTVPTNPEPLETYTELSKGFREASEKAAYYQAEAKRLLAIGEQLNTGLRKTIRAQREELDELTKELQEQSDRANNAEWELQKLEDKYKAAIEWASKLEQLLSYLGIPAEDVDGRLQKFKND